MRSSTLNSHCVWTKEGDGLKPIPENDLWIAASAFEQDLELVTRDSHFEQVENLRRTAW